MNFNFGNLVSAAVGAVSKVANAVVNALSPVAKGGGFFGGIAGAVIGAAIAVANVCEDGEIDEDEIEEILANVVKAYVGACMAMFGSGSLGLESYNDVISSAEDKENFYNTMNQCYGFKEEESELIKKAYDLTMQSEDKSIFKRLANRYKVKDFLANLSALKCYSGFTWECVADTPTSDGARKYFKDLGMSDEEIDTLSTAIYQQHKADKPGTKDFGHEIIEIASYYNKDAIGKKSIVDIGSFGQTLAMSNFKGDIWSGSMSDADLNSNIDSTNIYHRMQKDVDRDFMDIYTDYNMSVLNGTINKGEEFCRNYGSGDIEVGKAEIKRCVLTWSPVAEYSTDRYKKTIPYIKEQIKDGFALSAYMSGDPGLNYTKEQVDKTIEDMNKSTKDYTDDISKKDKEIEDARNKFFDFLEIKHK